MMGEPKRKFETIDDFISSFPDETQEKLEIIRRIVKEEAPEAEETISYGIPTFKLNGNLVHFAALKNHIGFYPTPSGIEQFKEKFSQYKTSKGAVQFPLGEPLPEDLIRKVVVFRLRENLHK